MLYYTSAGQFEMYYTTFPRVSSAHLNLSLEKRSRERKGREGKEKEGERREKRSEKESRDEERVEERRSVT